MTGADAPKLRLGVLAIVAVSLFATLFARLWFLQVASSEGFSQAAEANRVRIVQVEAPRGRILDREGRVLVDNRVSIVVTVDRVVFAELSDPDASAMLRRLAEELTQYGSPATVEQLIDRVNDQRYSRFAPVPVAEDVSEETKIFLEEHAENFPSVNVERVALRRYPFGVRAAHLLGYVGEISLEELEDRAERPKSYIRGSQIGKTGIERIFEDDLRGRPGVRRLEVNAANRPVRVIDERPPVPGEDVWLTIDLSIQALAEDSLAQGLAAARARPPVRSNLPNVADAGAVVVLDPSNGDVLAMASYPTYDPADFVNGISSADWAYLTNPDNDFPINNRAIQGQYTPGSTFKLVTGYGAVTQGLRTAEQIFRDTGTYQIDNCTGECNFNNAGKQAYGNVDLSRALTVSSDAYFYAVGAEFWEARNRLGEEALQDAARTFGFGQQTGIQLPSEQSGRIPTPRQRREQYDANPGLFATGSWFTGDNVITAIGQGDVAVTPLQLANAYATFANGGTRHAPNIARKITAGNDDTAVLRTIEPRINGIVEFSPELRQSLLTGLVGVTSQPGGTARSVFRGFPLDEFPVAGKTGTAEVDKKADTSVFAAFGPVHDPRFQVAVIMEEAGFGSQSAAPVARRLFDVFAGITPLPEVLPGGALAEPLESLTEAEGALD